MNENVIRWTVIESDIYGDLYKLSDNGKVMNTILNREISQNLEKSGTYSILLKKNRKTRKFYIEDLIAKYYLPKNNNPESLLVHIDGNLLNTNYTNLKYSDFTEPGSINYKSKYEIVFQFDLNYNFIRVWKSITYINKTNSEYKESSISACINGQNKSAYNYIWSRNRGLQKEEKKIISILDETCFMEQDNFNILDDNKGYWKDIIGYEDRYKISTDGNVYSKQLNKLFEKNAASGYHTVKLYDNNMNKKVYSVHKLVAIHFIKNPNNLKLVDHIDENKLNNHYKNLRWFTASNNSQAYQDNKKKPEIDQYDLQNNLIKEWKDIREILEVHQNYKKGQIYRCINGGTLSSYGFIWKLKYLKEKKPEIILKDDEVFVNIGVYQKYDLSRYEVSTYGNVRHAIIKNILNAAIGTTGYYTVSLYIGNNGQKQISLKIHKLVAHKFCKKKNDTDTHVNHIDENKLYNYYKNLEWTTHTDNITHSTGRKVNQIDIETGNIIKTFVSIAEAAKSVNSTNQTCITKVCMGQKKTAYGYKWEYADKKTIILENNIKLLKRHQINEKAIYDKYKVIIV